MDFIVSCHLSLRKSEYHPYSNIFYFMKIIDSRYVVEVHCSIRIYVYFVSPTLSRIDAVDDVLKCHKQNYPDLPIDFVKYTQEVKYSI